MTKATLGLTAAIFVLGLAGTGSAQPCMRLSCSSTQQCSVGTAGGSEGGRCCCNVQCSQHEGTTTCACTTTCQRSCSVQCPGCPCDSLAALRPDEQFHVTSATAKALSEHHLLTKLILSNVTNSYARPVTSMATQGMTNFGEYGDYRYTAVVSATDTFLAVDYIFERVGFGPLPDNVRVEVDPAGNVTVLPLSSAEVALARVKASLACTDLTSATESTVVSQE